MAESPCGPQPPRPTSEEITLAHEKEPDDPDLPADVRAAAQKRRAWREWSACNNDYSLRTAQLGDFSQLGIRDEKEHGKAMWQGFLQQYNQMKAADPRIAQFERSPDYKGWLQQGGGNPLGAWYAYQERQESLKKGRYGVDPTSGLYYNRGSAAMGDYGNYQWQDKFGNKAAAPGNPFGGGPQPGTQGAQSMPQGQQNSGMGMQASPSQQSWAQQVAMQQSNAYAPMTGVGAQQKGPAFSAQQWGGGSWMPDIQPGNGGFAGGKKYGNPTQSIGGFKGGW